MPIRGKPQKHSNAGRPQIQIDKETFEKLCGLQATKIEIASFFKCSEDTIERWCQRTYNSNFAVVYKNYSADGLMSLRRTQFRLAEKSAAMAIWLGKQYLNQSDNIQAEEATQKTVDALIEAVKNIG